MTYLKMLGLFAVTAVAMMAFAGSASATFTSPTGTEFTGEIDASGEETLTLKAGLEITCNKSTVRAHVETNHTDHVSGKLTELSFSECNGTTSTLSLGSLTIKGDKLFAIGSEVTVLRFGISCVYGGAAAPGTEIGTVTNTTNAQGQDTVTLHIGALLPKKAGGAFCAANGTWTGSYTVTTPHPSYVDFT